MVLGSYERFVGKPRRERDRQYWEIFDKGYDEGLKGALAECADWNRRRMEREAQGEPFSEPVPGSREADEMLKTSDREKDSAKERTWLERLRRHWTWPHLVILFLVSVVIDPGGPGVRSRVAGEAHRRHRGQRHGLGDSDGIPAGARRLLDSVQIHQASVQVAGQVGVVQRLWLRETPQPGATREFRPAFGQDPPGPLTGTLAAGQVELHLPGRNATTWLCHRLKRHPALHSPAPFLSTACPCSCSCVLSFGTSI